MSASTPITQTQYLNNVASAAVTRGVTAGSEGFQRLQLDGLDYYESYIQSATGRPRTGTDPGA